jgi:8-oxo-dGTP pyrophosphatase MutT (NUDIX family)
MIDESWYRRDPASRVKEAAGGLVLRAVAGEPYLALVREGTASGYVLPKGRLEPGETPEEAAVREIAEEAGLTDLRLVSALGVRERYDYRKTHWKRTHYFLFITGQVTGQPSDPHHAYVLEWFPAADLPAMFWPEQASLVAEELDRLRELARQPGAANPRPPEQALEVDDATTRSEP